MSALNLRKNLPGAVNWFLSGQFVDDLVDLATEDCVDFNWKDIPAITSEEMIAFSGEVLPDNSWRQIDNHSRVFVASSERALFFFDHTNVCASIICNYLDRLQEIGWEYPLDGCRRRCVNSIEIIRASLEVGGKTYSAEKIYALQGNMFDNGFLFWEEEPEIKVSFDEAIFFQGYAQACSTLMLDMLDKIKYHKCTGVYQKYIRIDEQSDARITVPNAIKRGSIDVSSDMSIRFCPSLAREPTGFKSCASLEGEFLYALSNCTSSYQSFFNDLSVISAACVNDDVISLPCFDEALYCALVREMHRYSLAEIADNKADLANKNAGLGAMVGSLVGLMSGNIFAPFLGHTYGKNISTSNKRIEEFLPDPNLLFYQDENSYLSWSKAQVSSPRLRRLIFDRRVTADGNVFFRLIPAIVTADSVFPIQLFKINSSTYFYRPFSAGIERNQPHYDSVKIQRRYFHLRGEGVVSETDMKVRVSGRDVEEYESKIFRFQGSSLDYFYLDFKTSPGSVF